MFRREDRTEGCAGSCTLGIIALEWSRLFPRVRVGIHGRYYRGKYPVGLSSTWMYRSPDFGTQSNKCSLDITCKTVTIPDFRSECNPDETQTRQRITMSHHAIITELKTWLSQQIIGQERLVDRLLIALLADGHLLVEGAPGLAKTKAIKDLSRAIEGDFHRIQFTPDLLPSDITGTEVFRPEDGSFRFQPGPIFHNLVLADEINRAPAKVQSALLEAMAEHQVSVGRESFTLPPLFLVMA